MAKEYIERDALLQEVESRMAWNMSYDAIYEAIQEATAADVVEVFRPDEAVLAEFEDDYKDFEKIKTHIAQIIVGGKVEKPCYSILWWDEESKEYNVGYSSYCLDYVRKWHELVFDVVGEADVVEVVRCKNCKSCVIDLSGGSYHLCMRHQGCYPRRVDLMDFCSRGERRDDE